MELSMKSRREIISQVYPRYRKATKAKKGKILDEFTETTGYTRKYAAWVLAKWGKTLVVRTSGRILHFKVGARLRQPRPGRPPVYGEAFLAVLKELWFLFDCLCGKRFVPMIRGILDTLAASGYLECDQSVREALARVSPATVDRLLALERKRLMPRGRSMTRPGSLLKKQVPVRTFADWSDVAPGFVEADPVTNPFQPYEIFHASASSVRPSS